MLLPSWAFVTFRIKSSQPWPPRSRITGPLPTAPNCTHLARLPSLLALTRQTSAPLATSFSSEPEFSLPGVPVHSLVTYRACCDRPSSLSSDATSSERPARLCAQSRGPIYFLQILFPVQIPNVFVLCGFMCLLPRPECKLHENKNSILSTVAGTRQGCRDA